MDGTGPDGKGPRQCGGRGFCRLGKDEQIKFLQSEKNNKVCLDPEEKD